MVYVRKFFAVVLIIILFPLLIINILVYSINSTILNPIYLQNTLSSNHVYEKVIESGLPILASSIGQNSGLGNVIDPNDLVKIAQKTISPSLLESQFNIIFQGLNNYLTNQSADFVANLDFTQLKRDFSSNFTDYVNQNVANLPPCSQADIAQIKDNQSIKCLPPGMSKNEIIKNNNQTDELLNTLPDQYDLGKSIMQKGNAQLETFKRVINYLNLGIIFLASFNIFVLLLIGLLIWKPASSLIKWVSSAIIIPSSLIFLGSIFGYVSSKIISPTFSLGLVLPVEGRAILNTIVFSIIGPLQIRIIIISGLLTTLAIIGYIIAHTINKSSRSNSSSIIKREK
ncbi:MAG: hypothetical protein ACD_58C00198G0001 [uncultured bacterium]|nr:MAG: hypothetical protein ACD_58C00198G0001 [uncultured bacterium]